MTIFQSSNEIESDYKTLTITSGCVPLFRVLVNTYISLCRERNGM